MPSKKRVLVAMSGGVDSSVAAALLLGQGYDVEGVTMQIWPDIADADEKCNRGCCSLSAVDDARRVAYTLGIKYHVWSFKDDFNDAVIEPFIREYRRGRTPNPCVLCNQTVKFEALLRRALALGFDAIATGHYANIVHDIAMNRRRLLTAGHAKDQTYALYTMTQHQLAHTLMPVGSIEKPRVREIAATLGLQVADKPDSQEICFVEDNDYARFIESRCGLSSPGNYVNIKGEILGRHRGMIHYTVGQRKGLGVTFGEPKYVVRIDAARNEVVLGGNEDLFASTLTASDLNWIAFDTPPEKLDATAKIRYNSPAAAAHIRMLGDDTCEVNFDAPQRAVTPGQSVVFYVDNEVVGGGVIEVSS